MPVSTCRDGHDPGYAGVCDLVKRITSGDSMWLVTATALNNDYAALKSGTVNDPDEHCELVTAAEYQ